MVLTISQNYRLSRKKLPFLKNIFIDISALLYVFEKIQQK